MFSIDEKAERFGILMARRYYIKNYISNISDSFFDEEKKEKILEEIDNDFESMVLFFKNLNGESENYENEIKDCFEWYEFIDKLICEANIRECERNRLDKILGLNLLESHVIDCFRNEFDVFDNIHGILDKKTRNGILKEVKEKDRPIIKDEEEKASEIDMVNHPPHYQIRKGMEVIDIIDDVTDWLNLKGKEAYHYTQLLGYILRYKKKNGKQDLEKARFFLNRMIDKYDDYDKKGE